MGTDEGICREGEGHKWVTGKPGENEDSHYSRKGRSASLGII